MDTYVTTQRAEGDTCKIGMGQMRGMTKGMRGIYTRLIAGEGPGAAP